MLKNYGISFGWRIPGLMIINGLILGWLAWKTVKDKDWGLAMVVIGGSLNFGERLIRGYVTDYWKIPMLPIYNNLNDWLIFGGGVIFLWRLFTKTKSR